MGNQKPTIPKGTRDFGPKEMVRRNYIFDTIKRVYVKYGYAPIETPAMENLSTLMGKYGDEGDKLLFKILNSGDFLGKTDTGLLSEKNSTKISTQISEKGLRYDLTVPFARFVVQHQNEIAFPFKRYQIQPVWRADRPQKGRYREFYQCDADVVGSNSLYNEVELLQIIDEVFESFGLAISIKLNNRKILAGIAEIIGAPEKLIDITVAIDKLDKIGLEKVNEELASKELNETQIQQLQPIILLEGSNTDKIQSLRSTFEGIEIGQKGIDELETVINAVADLGIKANLDLDLTLARGLNYYTGTIIEVKSTDVNFGSICGGGRYDDLTGNFGLKDVSGVGISFGAERIYDILEQLDKYPASVTESTKILLVNFGEAELAFAMKVALELRKHNINTEVFANTAKMKKQMNYANNKAIPFVGIIGSDELKENKVMLKDMQEGTQELLDIESIVQKLKS
jgi:histidyl-tRNA synthetase